MTRVRKSVGLAVLTAALAIFCVAPGFKTRASAAEAEELSQNLFAADSFAEYAETNGLTLPYALTDPAVGGIGCVGGGNGGDSAPQVKSDGKDTYLEFAFNNPDSPNRVFCSFFAFWDGTDTDSVKDRNLVKGKYKVTMVVREAGTKFATDNWGGRFFGANSEDFALIFGDKNNINDLTPDADGWKTYSFYTDVTTTTCDSIQMWFSTGGKPVAEVAAQIKSISVQRVIPQIEVDGQVFEFDKADPADLEFTVNLQGKEFEGVSYLGEDLVKDTDYTLNGTALVIKKEFLATLAAGMQTLVLSAGGKTADIKLEVIPIQPAIPDKEGYTLENTTTNGDFEAFEENTKFSENQAEGAWGSLSAYDYPATVVTKDGSKTLRLQKEAAGAKLYSSAFVMLPPELEINDIVTLKFDYLYLPGEGDPNNILNVAFVGATNTPNHEINLNGSDPEKTAGSNRFKWDIKYTALTGEREGWKQVELTFVVDTQLKTQCDSLRFLMNVENANADDVAYFDNVGLYLWKDNTVVDETPVIATPAGNTFDKGNPGDITIEVNTFGYNISSIKRGASNLKPAAFTVAEDYSSFTLKQDYLATLDNGTYTFTITTLGGTADFTVEVKGEAGGRTAAGCGCGTLGGTLGGGLASGLILLSALALAAFFAKAATRRGAGKLS